MKRSHLLVLIIAICALSYIVYGELSKVKEKAIVEVPPASESLEEILLTMSILQRDEELLQEEMASQYAAYAAAWIYKQLGITDLQLKAEEYAAGCEPKLELYRHRIAYLRKHLKLDEVISENNLTQSED